MHAHSRDTFITTCKEFNEKRLNKNKIQNRDNKPNNGCKGRGASREHFEAAVTLLKTASHDGLQCFVNTNGQLAASAESP